MVESIIFGLLQGLTEFLPISSSGHLVYFEHFFSTGYDLPLIISVHAGTALAIVFYFRNRIKRLILTLFKKDGLFSEERKMWLYLITGSIPAALAGFLLEPHIEKISTLGLLGICWIFNGLILIFGEIISTGKKTEALNPLKALIIGISQAIAILPGISRSGITIITARNTGIEHQKAFEFSFLLGIIAITGGFIFEILKKPHGFSMNCFSAALSAFIFGYIALLVLSRAVKLNKIKYFGFYTVIAGIFIFL